ncbi:MAG: hypothetical protein ABJ370_21790 [Paracoccaceae bacterium]
MGNASKRKKRVNKGHGSIIFIIILLCGSASLRVFSSATSAWATENTAIEEIETKNPENSSENTMNAEGVDKLLKILINREEEVTIREDQASQREEKIEVAKRELEKQLIQLKNTEKQLRATIALANSAAENDIVKLTAVYENMKAKVAAELFEEMDPDFAAGFLARMKSDSAASIMTGLTPQKAYSISVILAGRNANTPTE